MCSDNPEVVGSNPAPATNVIKDPGQRKDPLAGFLHCGLFWVKGGLKG